MQSKQQKNCDIKAADAKDASHKTAAMASNLLLIPLAKPGVVRDLLATNILLLRRERGMSQEALAFEVLRLFTHKRNVTALAFR